LTTGLVKIGTALIQIGKSTILIVYCRGWDYDQGTLPEKALKRLILQQFFMLMSFLTAKNRK